MYGNDKDLLEITSISAYDTTTYANKYPATELDIGSNTMGTNIAAGAWDVEKSTLNAT